MSKLIPILSGRCLVVELPEGAETPRIETNQSIIPYGQDLCWYRNGGDKSYGMDETEWMTLPPGNWRIIGMLSEVTEEQADKMVRKVTLGYWFDYEHPNKRHDYMCTTPIKSLDSAILAEGYLLESPPNPKCGCFGPPEEGVCPDCDEYMESLSRVLDRSRCLLLGRESKTPEFMGFKIERK